VGESRAAKPIAKILQTQPDSVGSTDSTNLTSPTEDLDATVALLEQEAAEVTEAMAAPVKPAIVLRPGLPPAHGEDQQDPNPPPLDEHQVSQIRAALRQSQQQPVAKMPTLGGQPTDSGEQTGLIIDVDTPRDRSLGPRARSPVDPVPDVSGALTIDLPDVLPVFTTSREHANPATEEDSVGGLPQHQTLTAWRKYRVAQLKEFCQQAGLEITGRKADLTARLLAWATADGKP